MIAHAALEELLVVMFSLSRPIGRIRFVLGVGAANSFIILATLVSFTFLPSGAGHIGVMVVMAALIWWWFSLHGRRFVDAGKGLFWPGTMAALCFATFALSYSIIAALWSVPEVQQEAFRTGGTDYTKHIETSAAVIGLGRWFAGWVGAAGAVMLAGFLAMCMGIAALLSGFVTLAGVLMSSRGPQVLPPRDPFRSIPHMFKRSAR